VSEVITNIKIVGLKENFASASTRGRRYFKNGIFTPKFVPQVSTHAHANFYLEVKSFTKNGDKEGIGISARIKHSDQLSYYQVELYYQCLK